MSVYILAEIASAHMGDPDLCLELIHKAKEAGADGVKVQVWFPEEGDFSHMMDKKIWYWGFLDHAPKSFDLWGQYYGDRSKAVCETFCDKLINANDKIYEGKPFYGFQDYPTKINSLNLIWEHRDSWAYADHTAAEDLRFRYVIPAMAIAAGATLIEKHICLDRAKLKEKSKDWVSALEPHEFKEFVEFIREAETAL